VRRVRTDSDIGRLVPVMVLALTTATEAVTLTLTAEVCLQQPADRASVRGTQLIIVLVDYAFSCRSSRAVSNLVSLPQVLLNSPIS
jgi:hypothetical protein